MPAREMRFQDALVRGRLLRRYKRFFADVELPEVGIVTAHCANPGSMLSCLPEAGQVWLQPNSDPKRKLKYTWQLLAQDGAWVMLNPALANDLVAEALQIGGIAELNEYPAWTREVPLGEGSRIDFALHAKPPAAAEPEGRARARATGKKKAPRIESDSIACWLEVKNATYALATKRLAFPDSVTERGTRHLRELVAQRRAGKRAVLLFVAARSDAESVEPADAIDPAYGIALREAAAAGVELLAYRLEVDLHPSPAERLVILAGNSSSTGESPAGDLLYADTVTRPVAMRLGSRIPVLLPHR